MSRKNRPATPAATLAAIVETNGVGEQTAIAKVLTDLTHQDENSAGDIAGTVATAVIKDAVISDLVVQSERAEASADAPQLALTATGLPSVEVLTAMAKIGRDIVVLIDSYRVEGAPTIFYPAMAEDPIEVVADLFTTILSLRERIQAVGATFAVTISPSSTDQDREKLLEAFDAIGVDVRAMSFLPTTPIAWAFDPAGLDRDPELSFAEQLADLTAGDSMSGFAEQFPLTAAALAAFEANNERGAVPTEIRVKSEREAFRRAGIVHSRAPRDYPAGALSADQVEILLADPVLTVEFTHKDD